MSNVSQATAGQMMDPIMARDPNYVAQLLQAQRARQLADSLTEQGMSKIDYDPHGAISPTQGLAKMLQAFMGGMMSNNAIEQQAGATTTGMNALTNAFQPQSLSAQDLAAATSSRDADAGQAALAAGAANPPAGPWATMQQGNNGSGPTTQNAQLAQTLARSMPVAQTRPSPLNPMGLDPALAASAYVKDPSEYFKAQLGSVAPTNEMKNWKATGADLQTIGQGTNQEYLAKGKTPEIQNAEYMGKTRQQLLAASLAKDAKDAEIDRKAGNEFFNPLLNQSGIVPVIPHNSNPVGPIAANGALPGGVQQIPGALPMVNANAEAAARGGAVGGFHSIQTPTGGTQVVPGDAIAPGGNGHPMLNDTAESIQEQIRQVQGNGGQPIAPADKPAFDREVARLQAKLAVMQPGIPQGQGTGAKVLAEGAGNYLRDAPQQITGLKQSIAGLENGLHSLDALGRSGPGMDRQISVAAVLQNYGLPVAKDATQNFQTLKKFLANASNTAAGANGSNGSDARLEQFLGGQPNPESMNAGALGNAIRYVLSQHDAGIAERGYVLGNTGGDPSKVQAARQQFAAQYEPKVFEFNRMQPTDRAAMVKGMNQAQLAKFRQQYNAANQNGWVQ